ncbi:ATP-dependent DNA helicase [Frankliniella fusca]|uniref:ATP-dependent DNA helicase n=1 Tax=Frankliniella fusca TaxID=407009 RepID=A0AAE1HIT5_9NEOP|nr:ATP-dependent DNA helicase [Frankliniella fusca]
MSTIPVDEFNTEGYIACAFPTLFCKGYADLRSPRSKKVNPGAYFQHLLNYKDGRFARHTTFRFFALNSWMRWTACTDGSILIKNMPELKNITVCQLNNMLKDDPSLMNRIFYQSSNIRGTKPYWKTRTGELMDMVEELGLPTIFLTLSCADLHWPDLFRVLTGNEDNSKLTEKERRDLLQKNPYIVDSFFHERVECFIETILKPKFKVLDYWYRVEYQHRGSPHIHGVFWFEGAPDVSSISPDNEEKLKEVKAYYDQLITAVNPNPSCECLGVHPCRLLFKDVINKSKEDVEQDLAKLLVKCQRHTKCSEETCLKAKSGGLKKCRFNFPQPLRENSVLFFDEQGVLQYEPARNDPLLNKFLELFIKVWRANFDISPVTNKQKLIMYLAKYISKSEIRSTSLAELFEKVLGILSDGDNILKVVRKLYISTCSDRDYSAQEVCHILSGRNLYSAGGRLFVNLNLNLEKCVTKVTLDKERIGKSVLEKYECRPSRLDSVSLLNFCKYHNVQDSKYYRRNKYNIVRVFPKLVRKPSDDDNEMFFRQLVLLHVPWRSFNDFQTTDQSWKQLVETHGLSENSNRLQLDPEQIVCDHDDDEDADDTDNAFDGLNLEEYMLVSRMGPKNTLPPVLIGLRDSDINHNWSEDASHYLNSISLNELENFIKLKKSEFKNTALNQNAYDPSSYTLSADQQAVVNQLLEQLQCIVENKESNDVPKITIVQGKAGKCCTGKSHLINYLRWKAQEVLKCNNCIYVVGPTGMSALNIDGRTIHSGLHMPTKFPNFELMSGDSLKKFNTSMKNVQFLIIDEYSMVGCRMLRQIDLRLRQAKGVNEPFGNVYVYLLGDIRQLPPVFDTPIYKIPTEPGIAEQGKALVSQVQKVFFLRECFRQKDPAFQAILDRISTGDITQDDYAVLSTRFKNHVGEQERKRFDDAVYFFSVKAKALDHNYKSLQELKCTSTQEVAPGVKITAKHNNSVAKSGTAEDAEGLEHTLVLAKGCNIMLTYNLWTEMGLVNGAKGTIVHILFEDGEEPPAGSPKIIMCKFQNYQGPGVGPDNLVPIPTITRFWDKNGTSCSRTQFPLTLFYACSVHKAQGVTETMAYVDIGPKEFHLGIAYVAFSRVKTLDGLLIEPFNFSRLSDLKNNANMKERLKFEEFLEKLSK